MKIAARVSFITFSSSQNLVSIVSYIFFCFVVSVAVGWRTPTEAAQDLKTSVLGMRQSHSSTVRDCGHENRQKLMESFPDLQAEDPASWRPLARVLARGSWPAAVDAVLAAHSVPRSAVGVRVWPPLCAELGAALSAGRRGRVRNCKTGLVTGGHHMASLYSTSRGGVGSVHAVNSPSTTTHTEQIHTDTQTLTHTHTHTQSDIHSDTDRWTHGPFSLYSV